MLHTSETFCHALLQIKLPISTMLAVQADCARPPLYDEFKEHGINGCAQNKTMLKCVKNHGNWFRHFKDISRRCEPSNVVAYFFGPPCRCMLCIFSFLSSALS